MLSTTLRGILADLLSSDAQRQLGALDMFLSLPISEIDSGSRLDVLSAALNALEKSHDPYFIAQRVARFGEEVISPLSGIMAHASSSEVRTLAALILLNKGSRIGVPILMREIAEGGGYRNIASVALANAGISEHAPAIIDRLRQYTPPSSSELPTTEDDEVLSLLGVLKKLGIGLPEDIERKYSDPLMPQYYRTAVRTLSKK